ncbi:MAG: putative nucleic acid-binding Zn ribbon protein [Myxococcota bacterium]|jgi:predicted  nucleic acid-binding Zn ribbon protein
MLLAEYSFHPREAVALEALEDEVQGLLASLQKNGQIWGEAVIGHVSGAIQVCLQVPARDALARRHYSEWVRRDLDRVLALCSREPTWSVVDDRPDLLSGATWEADTSLYLFTHLADRTSAVCSGANGKPVPLYLLPLSQQVREDLVFWAGDYRTLDELQIRCGQLEIPAYRQLAEVGSELTNIGRTLSNTVEEATGLHTYYFLMRYWGREKGENQGRCPGCGEAWSTPKPRGEKGLARFDFRCEPCRLVSGETVSLDDEAGAAIGEWPVSGVDAGI